MLKSSVAKKVFSFFLSFFVSVFAFAQDSSFDDEEILSAQISQIQYSIKNPVNAFWHASLLLKKNCENQKVLKLYEDSFSKAKEYLLGHLKNEENYEFYSEFCCVEEILNGDRDFLAKNFSKDEISEKFDFAELKENRDKLKNEIFVENLSNLTKSSNWKIEKISSLIDGTVTVYVDLGVKLQNGLAYPNTFLGSGFFIDEEGFLVTNYHVISSLVDPKYEGVSKLFVKVNGDEETKIPAKVVGFDKGLDLALLKTEIRPKYVFALGSSKSLDVGDKIFAIGSPAGLERTLTSGIISAQGRQLFSIATVIQLDAAINQGNSGGPIIDENGNVQGIAFAGMVDFEGLNFAIPVEYLQAILPRLYAKGEVFHSYLGIYGKTAKDVNENCGVEVLWMQTNGNASKAGLEVGDIITSVNGRKVKTLNELHQCLILTSPYNLVNLEIQKANGNVCSISVLSVKRSESPKLDIFNNETLQEAYFPLYGLKLKRVSSFYKNKYSVEQVVKGSTADYSNFSENDPIQVLKTYVNNSKYIMSEVYSKKKSNGYLDAAMVLVTQFDSENLF